MIFMIKIKKVNKNLIFNSIKDASKSVETKMEDWKVQMLIVNAINTGKKAFGSKWEKVS